MFEVELSKGDAKPKWFKNGTEIEVKGKENKWRIVIDGKKQRLEVYNLETVDAGEYSCRYAVFLLASARQKPVR